VPIRQVSEGRRIEHVWIKRDILGESDARHCQLPGTWQLRVHHDLSPSGLGAAEDRRVTHPLWPHGASAVLGIDLKCSESVLRCTRPLGPMTGQGQSRSFDDIRAMSGLPPASGPPRVIAVGLRSAKETKCTAAKGCYSITKSASQRAYLRPHSRMARTIGPRSRPFAVRTYSARGGLIE
jgi:hypothetical protein